MGEIEGGATPAPEKPAETEPTPAAEPQHTEGEADRRIPYPRFQEVVSERNALRQRLEELEKQREARSIPLSKGEPPQPPPGLTERQQVEWLVRHDGQRFLEEKFGMPLDEIAVALRALPEASRASSRIMYERLCAKHGLDPEDKDVQQIVRGLGRGAPEGTTVEQIMEQVAKILAPRKPQKPPSPSGTGDEGVSHTVTVEDFWPDGPKAAVEAARQGKRAPSYSTLDVIARRAKRG